MEENGNIPNDVTKEDVEIVINKAYGSTTKLLEYQLECISKEKIGFMGVHRHLVVKIQTETNEVKNVKFFVKSIPHEIEVQASLIAEAKSFIKESGFYMKLAPELLKSIKDKSWNAKYYLIKNDAMIFEDLKFKNYKISDKVLDINHLKSALTSLAKLHVSSILTEKRLGKSLLELYPDVLQECVFIREGSTYEWCLSGIDVGIALAKKIGLDENVIVKVCDRIFDLMKPSKTRRNAVNHGDAWSFNLMFNNEKPLPNCVMVDYQINRYVPAMIDICQLLYTTTRREFREKRERELLRFYHITFCNILMDNDSEIKKPSFDDILDEYEEFRVVGLSTAIMYLPTIFLDSKKCTELTKDSDGFNKLLFRERVKFVMDNVAEDFTYKERLVEILEEMVQKSKQFLKS